MIVTDRPTDSFPKSLVYQVSIKVCTGVASYEALVQLVNTCPVDFQLFIFFQFILELRKV